MQDEDWVAEFIQEVKKLAYDMPPPNPYTPMLLSHCLAAERRRLRERCAMEDERFHSLCSLLTQAK